MHINVLQSWLITILTLSLVDLTVTWYYVRRYRRWQPWKRYELIEKNIILNFLFRKLGHDAGMIIGGPIILALNGFLVYAIFVTTNPPYVFILYLLICLIFFVAIKNHFKNVNLLNKLIEKYPSGKLPSKLKEE